ncbi:MAG: tRNA threonylcarbamoyladenosine biosynthesis protein TsaB [Acidobacteriota bacterium]|jgi:tRNA threonylcarbamoyladenosine biosynthesis protein TsaB|nr:tRNA threonylcarbamoyladenosine biosynthesis protein TsaB [Acidobacteriota bacterium]
MVSREQDEEGLLTLGVDTTTDKRSVVLLRGGRTLAVRVSELREGGSANLLVDIDGALSSAAVGLREVELFAAAAGPGSFTGLRSGLATIKGLALTLGKPARGVSTLHAIAHAARPARRLLAAVPAGRGEVFAQLLGVSAAGLVTEYEAPAHIQPARLVERMARLGLGMKWAGGGALKFRELILEGAGRAGIECITADDAAVADETAGEATDDVWLISPRVEALAWSVAVLAGAQDGGAGESSAETLRAIYVRPSDAELKEQCHEQV